MDYREQDASYCIVSAGRTVSAVDLATGRELWVNGDFGDAAAGAMIVSAERVYLAGWKQAGAIDARTGRTVWSAKIACFGRPALLREGDRLLVGGGGVVECFSIDGQLLWRNAPDKANSVAIAIGDRVAYDDRER
jgi:outer membrane protein assembly factor BamB